MSISADRIEIDELLARLCWSVDRGLVDTALEFFLEEATLQDESGSYHGYIRIKDRLEELRADLGRVGQQHWLCNSLLVLQAQCCIFQVPLLVTLHHVNGSAVLLEMREASGELRRTDGRSWRIAELIVAPAASEPWIHGRDASDAITRT